MKKIWIVGLFLGLSFNVFSQSGHVVVGGFHGVGYVAQPRIGVGVGYYSPFYGPLGFYGYSPYWGLPYGAYNPYGSGYRPESKLQKKEEDIKSDYADRIYSVRHDNSLTSKQKREEVKSLKKQRNKEIKDMVQDYHKQPVTQ
jgi:hypothetical protein